LYYFQNKKNNHYILSSLILSYLLHFGKPLLQFGNQKLAKAKQKLALATIS